MVLSMMLHLSLMVVEKALFNVTWPLHKRCLQCLQLKLNNFCHVSLSDGEHLVFLTTGVSEETGPQTVSGCLPAETCPEDHQIPAHAQSTCTNTTLSFKLIHRHSYVFFVFICAI